MKSSPQKKEKPIHVQLQYPWTEDNKARQSEYLELEFECWHTGRTATGLPFRRDAAGMTRFAMTNLLGGMLEEGRKCMELAWAQFQVELPEALEASRRPFPPLSPTTGMPVEFVYFGWWLDLALCRWLLEKRHDLEALKMCSEEEHRFSQALMNDPSPARRAEPCSSIALNNSTPRHFAAGEIDRCLWYFEHSPQFRPPVKPTSVRSERAMAYVLAKHQKEGFWSQEEAARAWQTFLKTCVPQMLLFGADQTALWMKLAFWDNDQTASPEAVFFRIYDYLPHKPEQPKHY